VLATVAVGNAPYAVAFRHDGARAYVTNSHDDSVSVIDVANRVVVATVPVGSLPYGVTVDRNSGRLYVSGLADHSITIIDASNAVLGRSRCRTRMAWRCRRTARACTRATTALVR
jgi:YVTN family beta-propeller protein